MSFKSPWDRIAEALPAIGQTIAQGIMMSAEQKRLEEQQAQALELARQEARIADAQSLRGQAGQSLGTLAERLASMEAAGRGNTVGAVRIRERIGDLERAANMPIADITQANDFLGLYNEITNPQAAARTISTPEAGARVVPGREPTVGFQGVGGPAGRVEAGGEGRRVALGEPTPGLRIEPLGTPMQEATAGIGVLGEAARAEEEAAETEAEAAEAAAARERRTLSIAETLTNNIASIQGSNYYDQLDPEQREQVDTISAEIASAMDAPGEYTPSKLLSYFGDLASVQRAGGDIEAAQGTAQFFAERTLTTWSERNVSPEEALSQLAQLKGQNIWELIPEETRNLLEIEANTRFNFDPVAATAENAQLASNAVNNNMPGLLEGQPDEVWRLAGQAVGGIANINDFEGDALREAVSDRLFTRAARLATAEDIEFELLQARRKELGRIERAEYGEAQKGLMAYAQAGRTERLDLIEAIRNGEVEAPNDYLGWLAENALDDDLAYARDVAEAAKQDLLRADRTAELTAVIQETQATGQLVDFLSGYSQEDIYQILDERPEIASLLNEADVNRALELSQQRELAESIEVARAEAESQEVRSAYDILELASQNPRAIGEDREFQDRPGGPLRTRRVTGELTWDSLQGQLDVLVDANQMTQEHADVIMQSLLQQKRAGDNEAARALAIAQRNNVLREAGIVPEWTIQDYRTQILNLQDAAEATLNQALVPNEEGIACATRGPAAAGGGVTWQPSGSCQALREDYLAVQDEISRYTNAALTSASVQNIPPEVDLRGLQYIGLPAIEEISRMVSNGATVEQLNARADELRTEFRRQMETVRRQMETERLGDVDVQGMVRARQEERGVVRGGTLSGEERGVGQQGGVGRQGGSEGSIFAPTPEEEASTGGVGEVAVMQNEMRALEELARLRREIFLAPQTGIAGAGDSVARAQAIANRLIEEYRITPETLNRLVDQAFRGLQGRQQGGTQFPRSGGSGNAGSPTGGFSTPEVSAMAEGSLIAESGGDYAAINDGSEDVTGGWSYGKYQFASNGGLPNFISYLETNYPELYQELDTASGEDLPIEAARKGSQGFRDAWVRLSNNPKFQQAQDAAAERQYFAPANRALIQWGVAPEALNPAVLSALGETAVNIGSLGGFLEELGLSPDELESMPPEEVITAIYNERLRELPDGTLRWYQRSTPDMQEGVRRNLARVRDLLIGRL